ncbi:acyltransferase family protein [Eubacterium sp. 1001713B170207_170306_E7]|uniref:acyltransferase family protein n=1 Tax=Eubacterium sp. 1001713B170207_170306_E7 TaxID=2787097 RepID=UPI001897BFD5|nr:acyltransferase family protein [Eubacterium sp. 1001713B170207_170306_E7]
MKKNYAVSYLKCIAIILVLITHSISPTSEQRIGGPFWIAMAVPIFLIISGFNFTASCENKKIFATREWFRHNNLLPKLKRILLPYSAVYVLEIFLIYISKKLELTKGIMIFNYVTGGFGPGSYYIPILIQFLLLFPFILMGFKSKAKLTFSILLVINIAFDMESTYLSGYAYTASLYRLMIFRYFGFIISGVILYYYQKRVKTRAMIICLFIGFVYILFKNYLGMKPIVFTLWPTTSLPTVLWVFPIVFWSLKYLNIHPKNQIMHVYEYCGDASYHIFLTQMVYYCGMGKIVIQSTNELVGTILNVIICLSAGCLFYFIENKFWNFKKLNILKNE